MIGLKKNEIKKRRFEVLRFFSRDLPNFTKTFCPITSSNGDKFGTVRTSTATNTRYLKKKERRCHNNLLRVYPNWGVMKFSYAALKLRVCRQTGLHWGCKHFYKQAICNKYKPRSRHLFKNLLEKRFPCITQREATVSFSSADVVTWLPISLLHPNLLYLICFLDK